MIVTVTNRKNYGYPQKNEFVLIDAGMPKSAEKIISVVEECFGHDCQPKAIILTHGYFDYVGGIIELIKHWHVPVYAHSLELPYLTGEQNYPYPDSSVSNGWIAKMSPFFHMKGLI